MRHVQQVIKALPSSRVSSPVVLLVDPVRIPQSEVLHNFGQRNIGDLQGEMQVIRHPAKRMHPIIKAGHALLEQLRQMAAVLAVEEDRLAAVAPQDHMIDAARQVNTWFACHEGKDNTEFTIVKLSKPDPMFVVLIQHRKCHF